MGVRSMSKSKRRRGAATTLPSAAAVAAGVDVISDLSDDLLLRVLELLPDATDAVRTGALSRRWRALWTRVAALRFDSNRRRWDFRTKPNPSDPGRFVAFVDHALALRAAVRESALQHLAISFDLIDHEDEPLSDLEQLVPPSIEAAQGWIHYAMQHAVKSLNIELDLPSPSFDDEGDDNYDSYSRYPVMNLDELLSSAKLETMRLELCSVKLRLPSTAAFASLTDLSLGNMEVEAGGGHLLARLVSSACCPRLHRLHLVGIQLTGMEEPLLIDAGALLELSVLEIDSLRFLRLRTPSLRFLRVKHCNKLEGLTVSAPRLEVLKFLVQHSLHIDGDLSSVARLKIGLCSSPGLLYEYDDINDSSIRLLQCCRLIRCLEVSLAVPKRKKKDVDIIKGSIPQLPPVASLKIHVTVWDRRRSYASGIASLLAQCSSLRYLSLNFCYYRPKKEPELLAPNWESHELSLPHLQVAEFEKLMGTDDELQFIQFILTRALGIQKVTFSFDRKYRQEGSVDGFKLMPPLAGGSWTTWSDANLSHNQLSTGVVVVLEWRPTVEIQVLQ